MTCSKLEAMSIYVVNQACGNDILPAVRLAGYSNEYILFEKQAVWVLKSKICWRKINILKRNREFSRSSTYLQKMIIFLGYVDFFGQKSCLLGLRQPPILKVNITPYLYVRENP